MKRKQLLAMPIGVLFLALALLIGRFLPSNNIFNFMEGLFIGLSIVLNVYYVIVTSKKVKKDE
jgi:hypothetical protein